MWKFLNINLLVLFITVSGQLFAQQPAINSLYMFDQLLINPAYAGAHVQLSATAIHRNQWVNFPGSPQTSTVSLQSSFMNNQIGVGIVMLTDEIGAHRDNSLFTSYSYKMKLSNTQTLHLGLSAGVQSLKTDWEMITKRSSADLSLTGVVSSRLKPNFGTGIFYTDKKMYFGFSVPYLLNSSIMDAESVLSEAKRRRVYYITAGNKYLIDANWAVIPSGLIRIQEGAPLSFDLNAHLVYKDAIGLGMSYRLIDGIAAMFEIKVNENFHVGYAYDIITSPLQRYSSGTHEIMLNYRYKIPSIHGGLECPSYH